MHQGPCARARHQGHRQAAGGDQVACVARCLHHGGDGVAALGGAAQVLGAALVGVQARKVQPGLARHRVGQRQGGFARRNAAARLAHVDFHQHTDACLGRGLGHGFGQAVDAVGAVYGQRQPPALRLQARGQAGQAQQFGQGDHFVGDGDVVHAAGRQCLGLGGLLYAGAGGTSALQPQGQLGAFVRLGVRAPQHLVLAGKVGHARDVAFHGVEVDHQCGRIDLVYAQADAGAQGFRQWIHRGRLRPGARCRPSRSASGRPASRAGG